MGVSSRLISSRGRTTATLFSFSFPSQPDWTSGILAVIRALVGRGKVLLGKPLDAESIAELNAAKVEFVPWVCGN
jgi:hypothetical protein